jgi:hypothetical protein
MKHEQFNEIKDDLFLKSDLKFQPKVGNKVDKKIDSILRIMKIQDLPILNLKDKLYLVGLYKFNLALKGDFV